MKELKNDCIKKYNDESEVDEVAILSVTQETQPDQPIV